MDNIVKLHGPPASIISDRDTIFTSKLWQEIFGSFNISFKYSSAHHPKTDGQTERVNQCLEQYLRYAWHSKNQRNGCNGSLLLSGGTTVPSIHLWRCRLLKPYMNILPHSFIRCLFPATLLLTLRSLFKKKDHMLKTLQANLLRSQNHMKRYADANRSERTFQVGDLVYLKMQPYRKTTLGLWNALKLTSQWYGPFIIL
jgi:hypothetical protein